MGAASASAQPGPRAGEGTAGLPTGGVCSGDSLLGGAAEVAQLHCLPCQSSSGAKGAEPECSGAAVSVWLSEVVPHVVLTLLLKHDPANDSPEGSGAV